MNKDELLAAVNEAKAEQLASEPDPVDPTPVVEEPKKRAARKK